MDGLTDKQRRSKEYQKEYQKNYRKPYFQKTKGIRQHCDCCNIEVLKYTWAKHIVTAKHRKNLGFNVNPNLDLDLLTPIDDDDL
jgi:hypothetical protein